MCWLTYIISLLRERGMNSDELVWGREEHETRPPPPSLSFSCMLVSPIPSGEEEEELDIGEGGWRGL